MNIKHMIFLVIMGSLILSACAPQSDAGVAPLPPDEELPIPTLAPTETTLPDDILSLSPQPYLSPSFAFEVFFPAGWNCSESGEFRVDCQSPSGDAAISVRVIGTGYELSPQAFEALADAELISAYSEKKAYIETARESADGLVVVSAEWREGEIPWQGEDRFARDGVVAYHLSFNTPREDWEVFSELFTQVSRKAVFDPKAMNSAPVYGITRKYSAPDLLFTLQVPTSWIKFMDSAKLQQTQIEGFLAPDQHASIQVAVYRQGAIIKKDFKAVKTLEMLRAIYGSNFRVSHDKALPDGRERLAWSVENKGISGISFFDSWGSSLYIFTVLWDDEFQYLYQPILERVVDSFGYE